MLRHYEHHTRPTVPKEMRGHTGWPASRRMRTRPLEGDQQGRRGARVYRGIKMPQTNYLYLCKCCNETHYVQLIDAPSEKQPACVCGASARKVSSQRLLRFPLSLGPTPPGPSSLLPLGHGVLPSRGPRSHLPLPRQPDLQTSHPRHLPHPNSQLDKIRLWTWC